MKEKEKDFKAVIAGIRSQLKNGDIAEIARRCRMVAKTWHEAAKKGSWDELTGGEMRIVIDSIAYLKERDDLKRYAEDAMSGAWSN